MFFLTERETVIFKMSSVPWEKERVGDPLEEPRAFLFSEMEMYHKPACLFQL